MYSKGTVERLLECHTFFFRHPLHYASLFDPILDQGNFCLRGDSATKCLLSPVVSEIDTLLPDKNIFENV